MKALSQRVLECIREQGLLAAGQRTGVAVSGGLDSVALLRLGLELRSELGIVLSVVHFNHQLRGDDSLADEKFVVRLAERHGLEFHGHGGDVRGHSIENHLSLEAAARELRYRYFFSLLENGMVDRVATAHTLDDQAETVILRLARGSGTRGLAGIYPQVTAKNGVIVRPLLQTRRVELETYLHSIGQDWREDQSNTDLSHARNRVRHTLLPILERELNPGLREALAETAGLARDEEEYWNTEVEKVLPRVRRSSDGLHTRALLELPLALQRRVVRRAAGSLGLRLEVKHVREILRVAQARASSAELPNGWSVLRDREALRFENHDAVGEADYEYRLTIPGWADVAETRSRFEAVTASELNAAKADSEDRLDISLLENSLTIRNWHAGDRFWPAHTKAPKKIKELLQERKIGGRERRLWPVIASGSDIVWLRGFAIAERYRANQAGQPAVVIREHPVTPD